MALKRATGQPPAQICVSTQFTPDCFRFWPVGSNKPLGTEIMQRFWAACFTVFMVTVAKAHSRSQQEWGIHDLHSSLGIVLNNSLGFPLLGVKDAFTLLHVHVSEWHVLVGSNWEQWSPKRICSDCTCKHYTGRQVEQQSVCILDMQTPYK